MQEAGRAEKAHHQGPSFPARAKGQMERSQRRPSPSRSPDFHRSEVSKPKVQQPLAAEAIQSKVQVAHSADVTQAPLSLAGIPFSEMGLTAPIQKALQQMKFTLCTPVQAQAIPIGLTGRDLVACAQTGTGKTGAFCIPILEAIQKDPSLIALVLVPTRELAMQVAMVAEKLSQFLPMVRRALIMGGNPMARQTATLTRQPNFIIATPGRLLDHLRRHPRLLDHCGIFVLDEADRMLDMGFAPQLNQIVRHLPKRRQTLMFSATFPKEIEKMAAALLHEPARVAVTPVSTVAPRIEQRMLEIENPKKAEFLLDELNQRQGSILIFTRTKRRTDKLAKFLAQYGHAVGRIHGDRSQGQRNLAISQFREGKTRILVATDVAARGIDIPAIAHVVNFDLPQVPEDFVHRIGRTARAGASGCALSLVCREERAMWKMIEKLVGKTTALQVSSAR